MIYLSISGNSIDVRGHAGYGPKGQDIVCSAVSALTYGLIQGLEKNTESAVNFTISDGVITVQWTRLDALGECLLQTYIDTVGHIRDEYGHVSIAEKP